MSITLKTSKPRMFSTVLDVIRKGRMIRTDTLDFIDGEPEYSDVIISDGELENFIISADGLILSYLNEEYGGASGLRTTPWISTPFRSPKNQDKGRMISALMNNDDAYSAFWIVEFSDTTAFTVISSLEGTQGTGGTATDFTTTNTDITIGTNSWQTGVDGFTNNDQFFLSLIDSYPVINKISSSLAAAECLMELYSEVVPNANEYAIRLREIAMSLLKDLADGTSSLTSSETQDLSSTAIDYHITTLGEDDSGYLTENDIDV